MCVSEVRGVTVLSWLACFPKDQLAADMYSFVSKEGEYARCFVTVSAAPGPCLCTAGTHTGFSEVTLCAAPFVLSYVLIRS